MTTSHLRLRDVLLATRDGDWGKDEPKPGFVPYRVIRGGDFPAVRFGDISAVPRCYLDSKTVQRRTLQANDIVIETAGGTRDRCTGRTLLIKRRLLESLDLSATCASFARFLRIDPEKAVPEYVYWYLQYMYDSGQMWQHQVQHTGVARFQFTAFADSVEIPLPSQDEQRTVAHVLGTLDDKIELNRRMNETLEAIARVIFKSWFVDFDPARAKASGEPPESICRRLRLTPDVLALFPGRLVDSELGEIPEGWSSGTIADHSHLNGESWTDKTLPTEVHYVDLANAKNGVVSQVQVLSSSAAPSRARRVLHPGDTIVGTVRPGNRSFALIGADGPQLTGSTGFAVLTPKRVELREIVYFLATSEQNITRLSHLADGAAYPAVRPEVVTAGACVLPSSSVIKAFHELTSPMIDQVITNRANDKVVATIRDALLPKLLSGELHVPLGDAV